jgi:CHC2 zinc finger
VLSRGDAGGARVFHDFLEGGVARIPDAEIGRLKEQVSLVSLAEARGVTLRQTGADLTGCCPFHQDRSPSLVISPGKSLWHCLGARQAGGRRDRLGDAGGGRVVPARGGAAARRAARHLGRAGAEVVHGPQAGLAAGQDGSGQ